MSSKQGSNTYFISDTHFYHRNILEYSGRPFSSVEEMHKTIIRNWNSQVRDQDTVIVVGDFSFGTNAETKGILDQLKGTKILVKGNHDKNGLAGFDFVCETMTLKIADEFVLVCHYPYKHKWYKSLYNKIKHFFKGKKQFRRRHDWYYPEDTGGFLLNGHSHSKLKVQGRAIHVGVDAWNFKPIPLQKIADIIVNIKKGTYVER